MGILISDEVDFRREYIIRAKKVHFILQSGHKNLKH